MPTLYLLRHAKSSWDERGLADVDRPLSRRGRRNAAVLAAHLRDEEIAPELVLCSPSLRTRQTLAAIGLDGAKALFEEELYGASGTALLARIRALPTQLASAMVIGHNPGLEDLGRTLGAGDEPLRTSELLTFELASWAAGSGRPVARFLPR